MTKVALFCGGRGSATIIREFLRWPNIELTLLVNAYDDGLSTGALRRFIPGMLGPSDVRKNLSYLLDLYSDEQFALKNLFEMRLPLDFEENQQILLRRFADSGELEGLISELRAHLEALSPSSKSRVQQLLRSFFNYEDKNSDKFDYRDCAVGNILFAGCYLESEENFNKAASSMAQIVSAQEKLVNVCVGEDRILVALKNDGELLSSEAEVVGKQNDIRIKKIFFMDRPITAEEWSKLSGKSLEEKSDWLENRSAPTKISSEAEQTLANADIIVYGPGTQHSSLLPSYQITSAALRNSKAHIKVYVLNIDFDHDIQGLSANDLIDLALNYMGDPENKRSCITHILYNNDSYNNKSGIKFYPDEGNVFREYKNAVILEGNYSINNKSDKHSGYSVVRKIMRINSDSTKMGKLPSIKIYIDPYKRTAATSSIIEEFSEINWLENFGEVSLEIEHKDIFNHEIIDGVSIKSVRNEGSFPEVAEILKWLKNDTTDYLVTITGDGQYRFRDIVIGVELLQEGVFGAFYGSRNQSRRQFAESLMAAYNENIYARYLSQIGAFVLTFIYLLKCGVIFSDPLTGFRIYRRSAVNCLTEISSQKITPATITKHLLSSNIEIAEMPVSYRTFSGFTDIKWRINRGLANLIGII